MPEAAHPLDDLLETLPQQVVGAAELLSLSQWTDDSVAVDLVNRFSSANGTTVAAVAELKRLPFVSPVGPGRWKIAAPVRGVLAGRMEQKAPLARQVDAYLADRFAAASEHLPDGSPEARLLTWRSAYHRLPVDPGAAFLELDRFVERAASVGQLSDMRAAVELTEQRSPWLTDHQIEVAYIVGRYAYSTGDVSTAEDRFLRVWGSGTDAHRKVVSGHLLGVIWSRRNREPWWSKAEQVLTDAASLAREIGDRYGEAMILTTLGTLQLRMGGRERLANAEAALRRSLEVGAGLGGVSEGLALGSLGAVLARRGSRAELLEAEGVLRRSLELLPAGSEEIVEDRLVNVLGRLGGTSRLSEAEQFLVARLQHELEPEALAVTLNVLATTLLRRRDAALLPRAEEAVDRSIQLGKEVGNRRHTAMALLTGSFIAERAGDLALAIARMEEVIAINEDLGLAEAVRSSSDRLAELRSRTE